MSLVALDGTPLVAIGHAGVQNTISLGSAGSIVLDATAESMVYVGQIFTEDGASHTIDTTGSSSLGWLTAAITFANAGTTVKVGLATVLATAGPPVRAVHVADVITFDVSKSLTGGGGGITGSAWQEHVPDTGTKTIANGDLVAFGVQATAIAGVDVIRASSTAVLLTTGANPNVTSFLSAAYANAGGTPNAVITFSDGTYGFFFGGNVYATSTSTQTWNSGSATKEYGNYFLMPVPAKIYGIIANVSVTADLDIVLYSDPLGTPVAEKTYSIDSNTVGSTGAGRNSLILFPAPYTSTASQPLAAIVKPGGSNVSHYYKTFQVAAHQKSETLGSNCYAVNRAAGAFAAQNSSKDRFAIGLLVGAFDSGVGGLIRHTGMNGGLNA